MYARQTTPVNHFHDPCVTRVVIKLRPWEVLLSVHRSLHLFFDTNTSPAKLSTAPSNPQTTMARILNIAAVLLLGPATALGAPHATSPTANTTSGLIIGHAAPNRSEVTEFLGIRYAEPPVGDLRFAPPKRYNAPAGTVHNASDWGADCLSNKPPVSPFPNFSEPSGFHVWNMFAAQTGNPSSEDCLSLNIWTKTPNDLVKKPVLIWFHGGRKWFAISQLTETAAIRANHLLQASKYLVRTAHSTMDSICQQPRMLLS